MASGRIATVRPVFFVSFLRGFAFRIIPRKAHEFALRQSETSLQLIFATDCGRKPSSTIALSATVTTVNPDEQSREPNSQTFSLPLKTDRATTGFTIDVVCSVETLHARERTIAGWRRSS